tara:strand:+ start:125 stop:334 length:210 start_codon:yes stop_codon:yes gene_type:complete
MSTADKYIIIDDYGYRVFVDHSFESSEDGWSFLYCKFPVIELEDGTTDDQEEELDQYRVMESTTPHLTY